MKSEKLSLKKKFIIIWIILIAVLLVEVVGSIIKYANYKKGQDLAVASMLIATSEFNKDKDDRTELIERMYNYFNQSYYSVSTKYGVINNGDAIEALEKAEDSLESILNEEGYNEGYRASYYFKFTNFFSYYFYKNVIFIVIYGIVCGIALAINIWYVLSRKVEITVDENMLIYKKFNNKIKQVTLKNVTSVETTALKGIKITGNGIKIKTLLVKNNTTLKDYIVSILPKSTDNNKLTEADELQKYKKLLDDGAITEEEYNKKKKELLKL